MSDGLGLRTIMWQCGRINKKVSTHLVCNTTNKTKVRGGVWRNSKRNGEVTICMYFTISISFFCVIIKNIKHNLKYMYWFQSDACGWHCFYKPTATGKSSEDMPFCVNALHSLLQNEHRYLISQHHISIPLERPLFTNKIWIISDNMYIDDCVGIHVIGCLTDGK